MECSVSSLESEYLATKIPMPTKWFTKIDEKVTFQGNEAICDQSALQKFPKGILYREGKRYFYTRKIGKMHFIKAMDNIRELGRN